MLLKFLFLLGQCSGQIYILVVIAMPNWSSKQLITFHFWGGRHTALEHCEIYLLFTEQGRHWRGNIRLDVFLDSDSFGIKVRFVRYVRILRFLVLPYKPIDS